jgi:glycerol kinase
MDPRHRDEEYANCKRAVELTFGWAKPRHHEVPATAGHPPR